MHERLSKALYSVFQGIRKEPVFKVLKEIEGTQWLPEEQLNKIQWEKLKSLSVYAGHRIPFYRERLKTLGIVPEDINSPDDFRRVPFLTKRDIREHAAELTTRDERIKYTVAKTSGSTGTPLSIRMSQLSWAYHHANIIRALGWHGLSYFAREARIGGQILNAKKRVRSFVINFICNRKYLPARDMSDEKLLSFYRELRGFKPLFLYGYPTAIFRLATFIKDNGLPGDTLGIKFAVCHGEELELLQREMIAGIFKCRVINGYGAGEVGIIAYECPAGSMHIPAESIYVETVESPEGGLNDGLKEIVVTDLHNFAMPLIRYRIGDLGLVAGQKCSCGRSLPVFAIIKGKLREFIDTPDGRKVHTVVFNDIFKEFIALGGKVDEWQVMEEGPGLLQVNLVKREDISDFHMKFLHQRFETVLGKQVEVKFRSVQEIVKQPSGKFRAFIRK
jgi:phenylacetate-CoA ligase